MSANWYYAPVNPMQKKCLKTNHVDIIAQAYGYKDKYGMGEMELTSEDKDKLNVIANLYRENEHEVNDFDKVVSYIELYGPIKIYSEW